MRRSERRETLFRLLFMRQFHADDECAEQITHYIENVRGGLEDIPADGMISREEEEEIRRRLDEIVARIPEIDERLNRVARGWKTSRMSKVDLNILRLASYEILFDEEVPTGVAINEAVEIAKKYGGGETSVFVNGILGQIAKETAAGESAETDR